MNDIDERYVAEPGLVVFDVTGGDEETVRAAVVALGRLCATSGMGRVTCEPGRPGVTARVYADLLRPGGAR